MLRCYIYQIYKANYEFAASSGQNSNLHIDFTKKGSQSCNYKK